jgi:hypothetical protein
MTPLDTQIPALLTPIIVDGAMLHRGHRWSWRRGVVLGHGTHGFVRVRLERRGRERRQPEAELAPSWCLMRTVALEATLRRHEVLEGLDDAEWQP